MQKIEDLLKIMIEKQASDIYIISGHPVAFRVNDKLEYTSDEVLTKSNVYALADSIMNNEQKKAFVEEWEMNMSYQIEDLDRFRCNVYRQKSEVGMVFRRISSDIPEIEDLGLPVILRELIMKKRGLILVTGATGSGKSTTMASMLEYRNKNKDGHIITIEDPIEYFFSPKKSLISQREVGIDTKSFPIAMKSALRQTPDILMVGEMRDKESVNMAIAFAETGHLVVSTLHSINATQSMQRIMQYFPQEAHPALNLQLSQNLRGVISQRLLPKAEGEGRVVATEIMLMSPRICELVKTGEYSSLKSTMEKVKVDGMHTFDQCLYDLYDKKKITEEIALVNADSPNNLRLKMKGLASGSITIE